MEDVLKNASKVMVDGKGGQGVVPYLPLPELKPGVRPPAAPLPATMPGGTR